MLRNKDVILCGVGAEARMFVHRFDTMARPESFCEHHRKKN
jgi:hypothetical protein